MAASGKTNLTTPIIILVILGVLAFVVFRDNGGNGNTVGEGAQLSNLLVDVDRDAISRLDVSTPDGVQYSLLKQEDSWFALRDGNEYPADESRVSRLLDELPDLKSDAVMSEKAEQHPTFELNEDQAYSLQVYAGGSDPKVSLLVGKSTPNMKGCYLRLAGVDKVHKADANLRTSLGYSFDDYRSKQVWNYDPALATEANVTPVTEDGEFTGEAMQFSRDGELWKLADGSNGNQNDIQELVDKFSGLRVQTFIDDPSTLPEEQYDPDAVPCLVVNSGGEVHTLTIHGREEGNIVVSDSAARVYKTSRSNLNFLLELDFSQLAFYEEPPAQEAEGDAAAGEDAAAEDAGDADEAAAGEDAEEAEEEAAADPSVDVAGS